MASTIRRSTRTPEPHRNPHHTSCAPDHDDRGPRRASGLSACPSNHTHHARLHSTDRGELGISRRRPLSVASQNTGITPALRRRLEPLSRPLRGFWVRPEVGLANRDPLARQWTSPAAARAEPGSRPKARTRRRLRNELQARSLETERVETPGPSTPHRSAWLTCRPDPGRSSPRRPPRKVDVYRFTTQCMLTGQHCFGSSECLKRKRQKVSDSQEQTAC